MSRPPTYAQELKIVSRKQYDAIQTVYCPCLDQHISFNAQGFHHMEYDGKGRARTVSEFVRKLTLLPFAPKVLKIAQNIEKYKKEKIPKDRKQGALQKYVEYWAFVAHVGTKDKQKIRVVVRRIGNGNMHFWSVMALRTKRGVQ